MSKAFPSPCVDCGQLTRNGTRCEQHDAQRKAARDATRVRPNRRALYDNPDYRKRAKAVRENATVCWICKGGPRPDDAFQADHLLPGDPTSPLAAAHRSCNARRGNKPIEHTY